MCVELQSLFSSQYLQGLPCFWDQVLLGNPGWPQTSDPSASPPECWITDVRHHIWHHTLRFELRYYMLSNSTSAFLDGCFWVRVSQTISLGWLWTTILLISASWVARITGWASCTGLWLHSCTSSLCLLFVRLARGLSVLLLFSRTSCLVHLSSLLFLCF
jgi:hypothetical protein